MKIAFLLVALVSTAASAAEREVKEVVDVTITGGPSAGKYRAATDRGGCSAGLAGPGSFGSQLSDPKNRDTKAFNSVQLVVPDAKNPREFQLMVGFGSVFNRGTLYEVDTRGSRKEGSGTLTIEDKGSTAMVRFSARTKDGVKLEGTIDCKSVTRPA